MRDSSVELSVTTNLREMHSNLPKVIGCGFPTFFSPYFVLQVYLFRVLNGHSCLRR